MKSQARDRLAGLLINYSDETTARRAVHHLVKAIASYLSNWPILDNDGRRSSFQDATALRKIRNLRELAALGKIDEVMHGVRDLDVLQHVARAHGGPIGSLKETDVARVLREAEQTLMERAKPGRKREVDREVLAHDVALVLREVMGINPASTRDTDENIKNSRGGAVFALVLREAFEIAGISVADIGPYLRVGIALLNDTEIPHNTLKNI